MQCQVPSDQFHKLRYNVAFVLKVSRPSTAVESLACIFNATSSCRIPGPHPTHTHLRMPRRRYKPTAAPAHPSFAMSGHCLFRQEIEDLEANPIMEALGNARHAPATSTDTPGTLPGDPGATEKCTRETPSLFF